MTFDKFLRIPISASLVEFLLRMNDSALPLFIDVNQFSATRMLKLSPKVYH